MARLLKGSLIALILIILIFCAGCESLGITITPEETPTPVPTHTPIPTTIVTPKITPTPTVQEENITETTLPTPTPELTPIPVITLSPTPALKDTSIDLAPYKVYTDADLSLEYPGNWNIKRADLIINESSFFKGNKFNPDSRQIRFESNNPLVYLTVTTSDFKLAGDNNFDPSIENCRNSIVSQYNNVDGQVTLTNYEKKYTTQYQTLYVMFDTVIPDSLKAHQYTYAEMDIATSKHFYTLRFNTGGNLEDYRELKTHMFTTLVVNERG